MNQPSLAADNSGSDQELMNRMFASYACCHSYMDEGEVVTVFTGGEKRWPDTRPFSTVFVRPSDFRFEFGDRYRNDLEWERYIVWQGGESILTWWSVEPNVGSEPSLMLALAGATGVSSGSAMTIPHLLMPDTIRCKGIMSFAHWNLTGEETIGSAAAYKIQGNKHWHEHDGESHQCRFTIWVDRQTLLILQTFHSNQFEDFVAETTTTYRPQINAIVPSDNLAFNPPA